MFNWMNRQVSLTKEQKCSKAPIFNGQLFSISMFALTSYIQPLIMKKWLDQLLIFLIYQLVLIFNGAYFGVLKYFVFQILIEIVGWTIIYYIQEKSKKLLAFSLHTQRNDSSNGKTYQRILFPAKQRSSKTTQKSSSGRSLVN